MSNIKSHEIGYKKGEKKLSHKSKEEYLPLATCVVLKIMHNPLQFKCELKVLGQKFIVGITATVLLEWENRARGQYRRLEQRYDFLVKQGLRIIPHEFVSKIHLSRAIRQGALLPAHVSRVYCDIYIGLEAYLAGAEYLVTENTRDFRVFESCNVTPVTFQEIVSVCG